MRQWEASPSNCRLWSIERIMLHAPTQRPSCEKGGLSENPSCERFFERSKFRTFRRTFSIFVSTAKQTGCGGRRRLARKLIAERNSNSMYI